MATTLTTILDAQGAAQMSLDDLLATLEAEEKNECEFEPQCRVEAGMVGRRCGWVKTDINWCPKRKKYIGGAE